jgi:hypothetical protein
MYSHADVSRLHRIRYLVDKRGLNIAGLEVALGMTDLLDAVGPNASRSELRTAIDEALELSQGP